MKKINLSTIGFDERYTIDETGTITDTKRNRICKSNKKNLFRLRNKDGKLQNISLKTIYKKVFNTVYCIDNTESLEDEIWVTIPFDERYSISNYGRVKSRYRYTAQILSPYRTPKGYLKVDIKNRGYFVHRLVYEAFTGANAETIHHDDYNKQNNSIQNLMGMTRKAHGQLTQQHIKQKKEQVKQ